jgi:hypothetical protein
VATLQTPAVYEIDPILWLILNVFHREDESNQAIRMLSVSPLDDTADTGADNIKTAADDANCARREIVNTWIEASNSRLCTNRRKIAGLDVKEYCRKMYRNVESHFESS